MHAVRNDEEEERPPKRWPRPPVHTMTDWLVFSFVVMVGVILLSVAVGSIIWVFVSPDADISGILKALADIVSAMISALIGFLAGRGTSKGNGQ